MSKVECGIVVSASMHDWYWALTTARSVHAEVLEQTEPAGVIVTKASNDFWSNAKNRQGLDHLQAVEAHNDRTFFLMKRGNKTVGGFSIIAGELQGLWVDERGKGYGTWLLRQAIQRGAKDLNCFEGLVPFYKREGFIEVSRVPNWNEGGPDVVWMELKGE